MIKYALTFLTFFLLGNLTAQELYVKRSGKKYTYVNGKGKKVLKEKFDEALGFKNGLAAVAIDGKWGFIDKQGHRIISLVYDDVGSFRQEITWVEKQGIYGIIDTKGDFVLNLKYDSIYISSDYFIIRSDEKYGFYDYASSKLFEPKYEAVDAFYNDKIAIKYNKKWGTWVLGKEDFEDTDLYFVSPDAPPILSSKCALLTDKKERSHCNMMEMLTYIYKNISYPKLARQHGIQGTVVIQFIVSETGENSDFKIIRDIGAGCGEESLRCVSQLPNWVIPPKNDGIPVKMIFNIPVKFKLQ